MHHIIVRSFTDRKLTENDYSLSKSSNTQDSSSKTRKDDSQSSTARKSKTLKLEKGSEWFWFCRSCRSGNSHSTRQYQCANPLCLVTRSHDDESVDWECHPFKGRSK
jgi:hypothetical protein